MTSKTIKWTAGNGSEIKVVVATTECLDQQGNAKSGTCELTVKGYIGGVYEDCTLTAVNHPVAVAKIGRIGIKAAEYAQIEQAIAECRADADLIAYESKISKALADHDAYQTIKTQIENA